MSASKKTSWIISYDISAPRRLNSVHRYLKRCGIPLQYSVFMTRGNEAFLDRIMADLAMIINPREDDVRAYPVPEKPDIIWIGKQPMPEEVTFCMLPNLENEMINRGIVGMENGMVVKEPENGEDGIVLC